ncbi:DUF6171 family protein [Paenibacillus sp. GCM10027628]|uniref:DUF6171 family protein n=1 Tax=Paenibacillus sp. GCM10027628 TaxID=3273413 RepID=UPI0036282188
MDQGRLCKGCHEQYQITEEQISRILQMPMFQSAENCVSDSLYHRRLQACTACPKLLDGMTCSVCGCLVRIAAKLKERSCPKAGDNRWALAD